MIPIDLACVGSKQYNIKSLLNTINTATTIKQIKIVCVTSESDIPNGLPKRICSRSILLFIFDTKTNPRAKKPVNTTGQVYWHNIMTILKVRWDFSVYLKNINWLNGNM